MIRVAALARPRVASSFGRAAVPRASLAGAAQDSWEVAVTPSNFAAEVMESPVPVILDCTASWCPPCKQLKPLLQRAVADADGKLKLAVLDTDAHPQLAQQLQVRSLPTVFGLANGELVDQFVGLVPQPQLDEFLAKLRASGGTVRDT